MDALENIPCNIDGTAFGRMMPHARDASATERPIKKATIAKPTMRDRGADWLSVSDEVDILELPPSRIATSTERNDNVRYVADNLDELWVDKVGLRARSLSIPLLENIFTALEILAYNKSSITFHRLHLDTNQLEVDCGYPILQTVADHVTEYWKARRRANGGLPLIQTLVAGDYAGSYQCDVLGDCPLPFAKRDGEMYASLQVENTPWRKRPRMDEATDRLIQDSRRLASALTRREDAFTEHLQLTLFELATVRREARELQL
jgi:hypothetical protein